MLPSPRASASAWVSSDTTAGVAASMSTDHLVVEQNLDLSSSSCSIQPPLHQFTAMTAQVKTATLPPAAYAGLKPNRKPRSQALWNRKATNLGVLRDQLSLGHWILVGATLQALLVLVVPLSKRVIVVPVLALAIGKILQAVIAVSSYRPGMIGDHVIRAKLGATMENDIKSNGGVCLLILGTRSYQ